MFHFLVCSYLQKIVGGQTTFGSGASTITHHQSHPIPKLHIPAGPSISVKISDWRTVAEHYHVSRRRTSKWIVGLAT